MSRLGTIVDRLMSAGVNQQAASAGIGAALGAVMGPAAATLTGDSKSDKNTLARDMLAGAIGGAVGGLMGPVGSAAGGFGGGLLAGMFDREKQSSVPGQDLRTPMVGGTKFPTGDSIAPASKKLNQSSAEVGSMPPTLSRGASLDDVVAAPRLKNASIGDPMDPMLDDPLVLYLQKEAEKDEAKSPPPLTDLVDGAVLKDNADSMPLGKEEHELSSLPPGATARMGGKADDVRDQTNALFSNAHATRSKYTEKDHAVDEGAVDRILGI